MSIRTNNLASPIIYLEFITLNFLLSDELFFNMQFEDIICKSQYINYFSI